MPCNYSCDNINAFCKVNEIFLIRKIFQQFFIHWAVFSLNTVRMVTFTGGYDRPYILSFLPLCPLFCCLQSGLQKLFSPYYNPM